MGGVGGEGGIGGEDGEDRDGLALAHPFRPRLLLTLSVPLTVPGSGTDTAAVHRGRRALIVPPIRGGDDELLVVRGGVVRVVLRVRPGQEVTDRREGDDGRHRGALWGVRCRRGRDGITTRRGRVGGEAGPRGLAGRGGGRGGYGVGDSGAGHGGDGARRLVQGVGRCV